MAPKESPTTCDRCHEKSDLWCAELSTTKTFRRYGYLCTRCVYAFDVMGLRFGLIADDPKEAA